MATNATSKAPAITLGFWITKIFATTLGETAGDALSMSAGLGYLASSLVFGVLLLALATGQIRAHRFHPLLYWATVIATTTVGTTLADFADRSLGIGYAGGASLLLAAVLLSLTAWRLVEGSVAVDTISGGRVEAFYWITIVCSQTLGTALGDWTADSAGLGYAGSAMLFGAMLALLAMAYAWTRVSRTLLFWTAFVLTRPLGAVVGDWLDKPLAQGGLELSRYGASGVLLALIVACIYAFPRRAA